MMLDLLRMIKSVSSRLRFSAINCLLLIAFLFFLLAACNSNRVYEDNVEFVSRSWKITEPALLEFSIADTTKRYNLYLDIRNSLDYPYARLFVNYSLMDSSGNEISKSLLTEYLFDQKTGSPLGESGLGDLYDHQFKFLNNFSFARRGNYKVRFEQFMRQDTLQGVLAVGLRVETNEK